MVARALARARGVDARIRLVPLRTRGYALSMSAGYELLLMIAGMHVLGLLCVAVLMVLAFRQGPGDYRRPSDYGSDDEENQIASIENAFELRHCDPLCTMNGSGFGMIA